jgi:hypothetical protein
MQPTSRLETLPNHPRTDMKLQALIGDLRWRVQLLDADIQDEEKRTGIFDISNNAYPILARNLRTRRDNLLATIAMLESRLGELDKAARRLVLSKQVCCA